MFSGYSGQIFKFILWFALSFLQQPALVVEVWAYTVQWVVSSCFYALIN